MLKQSNVSVESGKGTRKGRRGAEGRAKGVRAGGGQEMAAVKCEISIKHPGGQRDRHQEQETVMTQYLFQWWFWW